MNMHEKMGAGESQAAYGNLNQINSTDEDEQEEDEEMEDENDSIQSESSSFKHHKSKTIKKKMGGGFSKSPKLLPSHLPMNDLPAYYLLGGASNYVKDSKKARQQANLVRMRKDSLMSEKERRRQDRLTSNNLTQQISGAKEA